MTRTKEKHFVAVASRYAGDVVSGKILACQWTIKACKRQIDDLENAKLKSYPYRFDKDKASRVCQFIEMLPHIKGEWAKTGGRIELQPWQIFILTTVFGWIRKDSKFGIFVESYIMVLIGRDWRIAEEGSLPACYSYPATGCQFHFALYFLRHFPDSPGIDKPAIHSDMVQGDIDECLSPLISYECQRLGGNGDNSSCGSVTIEPSTSHSLPKYACRCSNSSLKSS
jgi:hypothetical protein